MKENPRIKEFGELKEDNSSHTNKVDVAALCDSQIKDSDENNIGDREEKKVKSAGRKNLIVKILERINPMP